MTEHTSAAPKLRLRKHRHHSPSLLRHRTPSTPSLYHANQTPILNTPCSHPEPDHHNRSTHSSPSHTIIISTSRHHRNHIYSHTTIVITIHPHHLHNPKTK
ncbi:hypothetical protein HanIR_Chr10g0465961 [Helianthus annuus]|nr:hypothetical protein HanIR_Chr10g0465961 [Helianthus annuus]